MIIYDENLNKLFEMGNNSFYLKTTSSDNLVSLKRLSTGKLLAKGLNSDLNANTMTMLTSNN
jgi:hypothetical protein